MAMLSIYLMK